MEQKPITKKQMQWRVSLGVASAILSCPIMWFSHTWIERILAGITFVCAIISIIQTIRQWKKHPLVDEAVDRELQEEKKGALTAMGGILLLFAFAIFLLRQFPPAEGRNRITFGKSPPGLLSVPQRDGNANGLSRLCHGARGCTPLF